MYDDTTETRCPGSFVMQSHNMRGGGQSGLSDRRRRMLWLDFFEFMRILTLVSAGFLLGEVHV